MTEIRNNAKVRKVSLLQNISENYKLQFCRICLVLLPLDELKRAETLSSFKRGIKERNKEINE